MEASAQRSAQVSDRNQKLFIFQCYVPYIQQLLVNDNNHNKYTEKKDALSLRSKYQKIISEQWNSTNRSPIQTAAEQLLLLFSLSFI